MEEIKLNKTKVWQIASTLLLILVAVSVLTDGFNSFSKDIGKDEAKEKTTNFLNTVLAGRGKIDITEIKEEKGLYMININLEGQTFNSYLSKDGTLFFPSVIMLDRIDTGAIYGDPPKVEIINNISNSTVETK